MLRFGRNGSKIASTPPSEARRRDYPENTPLIPSRGEPDWLHVRHCFPSVRPSLSVPTWWDPAKRGGYDRRTVRTRASARPASSGCTSERRPASARRAPCSTRGGALPARGRRGHRIRRDPQAPYTVEQIRDLPVVPRKTVRYRDADWEEMDVERVLARSPRWC